MRFFSKFRLRVLFQNVPSYLTMFLGIFLAGTLVVIGSMYAPLLEDYSNMVKESMISKYQYRTKELTASIIINGAMVVSKNASIFQSVL
mgnify:CR=1 FL=1